MTNMPIPPKGRLRTDNKWGPIVASVVKGNVVFVPGHSSEEVAGNLTRKWISAQGFRVRVRTRDNGIVAWIERRGEK